MIEAIVTGQGLFYADGTERLYLHIKKTANHELTIRDGEQTPIFIIIGGIEYSGTLRSRSNLPSIFVESKLTGPDGKQHKQTYLLLNNGFSKKQRVQLSIRENSIVLS